MKMYKVRIDFSFSRADLIYYLAAHLGHNREFKKDFFEYGIEMELPTKKKVIEILRAMAECEGYIGLDSYNGDPEVEDMQEISEKIINKHFQDIS